VDRSPTILTPLFRYSFSGCSKLFGYEAKWSIEDAHHSDVTIHYLNDVTLENKIDLAKQPAGVQGPKRGVPNRRRPGQVRL